MEVCFILVFMKLLRLRHPILASIEASIERPKRAAMRILISSSLGMVRRVLFDVNLVHITVSDDTVFIT